MKSGYLYVGVLLAFLMSVPSLASAHEQRTVQIGSTLYQFTVGSLNEPVVVDDKTGVDLGVKILDKADLSAMGANVDHSQMIHLPDGTMLTPGKAVEGLEKTLQVELQADGKKLVLPFTTVYGTPGKYKAVFFPTKQTQYAYRIFGTINSIPVDLLFSCNPAGHVMDGAVTPESEKLSDQVTILSGSGAFGCPAAKESLGFPVSAPSLTSLSGSQTTLALGLAAAALALSLIGFMRRRS